MLIEKDIQKILDKLPDGDYIKVSFDGSDIILRSLDDASKLSLMTLVYYGGNYIPLSVRHCLSHKSPFPHQPIQTFLTIDEQNFQIHLHYRGNATPLTNSQFKDLLEDFGAIAEKWRIYLDEHDSNDLVYVRVK